MTGSDKEIADAARTYLRAATRQMAAAVNGDALPLKVRQQRAAKYVAAEEEFWRAVTGADGWRGALEHFGLDEMGRKRDAET